MRGQREKIQNGPTGDEDEGGRKCSAALAERGQIVQWRYTNQGTPRRESQCYKLRHSRGEAPRMRASKSSEFGEGKL